MGALNKNVEEYIGETLRDSRKAHAVCENDAESLEQIKGVRKHSPFPPMSSATLLINIFIYKPQASSAPFGGQLPSLYQPLLQLRKDWPCPRHGRHNLSRSRRNSWFGVCDGLM